MNSSGNLPTISTSHISVTTTSESRSISSKHNRLQWLNISSRYMISGQATTIWKLISTKHWLTCVILKHFKAWISKPEINHQMSPMTLRSNHHSRFWNPSWLAQPWYSPNNDQHPHSQFYLCCQRCQSVQNPALLYQLFHATMQICPSWP